MRATVAILCVFTFGACSTPTPSTSLTDASRSIAKHLEKKLSISFEHNEPEIVFKKITTITLGSLSIASFSPSEIRGGRNKITISEKYAQCDYSPIIEGKEGEVAIGNTCEASTLSRLIAHEMGHHYTSLIIHKYAPYGWLEWINVKNKNIPEADAVPSLMVSEGIARYFEFTSQRHLAEVFNEEEFTRRYLGWTYAKHRMVYEGGYSLVREVLDINVHFGVRCLVEHELRIPYTKDHQYDFTVVKVYKEMMRACAKNYALTAKQ